ncbi:UDP-Glycosyltransferase/glycogen phosphorylase [Fomitiporia mediterranea MF3/22]|uniref:UDP-Glycosyltransferase/glycogen phosphorylase n=1 Tax=Fomitiporia mediterranea (strain MF3/22) TaxID=694068 RepID=R7SHN1_FOMME|nr:UDP-Glycosyltransferase/glycogen phosphorylase [Fomitiporia mediterranea MF3/22]EJC97777.1 UDP-Glycosyltransferase/glycogen phosphorylase [Fomitiporia mediterranea MF3/22]
MTIESRTVRGHIVIVTLPAWGHVHCACALAATIVRYRPVHVTIFVVSLLSDRVSKELDTRFEPGVEDDMRRLIRIVGLEVGPNIFDTSAISAGFMKEYEKFFDGKSHTENGSALDTIEPGPPQLVVIDFVYEAMEGIRKVSGHDVPVYLLQSACASTVLYFFGPDVGIYNNLEEELKAIPYEDKEAILEESDKIIRKSSGRLIAIPGLPPMYDHERMAQKSIFPKGGAFITASIRRILLECDGAICNTNRIYEAPSITALEEWFNGRPVINVGPLDSPLTLHHEEDSPSNREVKAFLDSALERYGPKSVVYMSFGSIYWTAEPDKIWVVLDAMIEEGVPFLFAHASPFATIPDEVKEKIKASGLGYSSNWLPQQAILDHQACGWFITHCGHNSVNEAISAGVPLVCWPFDADQPNGAANIASVHNLGYELFEVRTGSGLLPIHRLGDKVPEGTVESVKREFSETLRKMRGQDGAVKRANVQKFRDAYAKLWAPGGENWDEIKKITDILQ